ncbi:glycosyltransferase family 1 protein [Trematosphaeria pertusa]|uniref:UDP-N-acetylglucosamine transferase subunit ALG14 n=1 Tax=Trematosphaeria pertusa TaxID=390896 RepID=A0A6A6J135_9PLEO|nr:glycosyltransferase family 1 protein [Trematosphaeria pertusa]KAF2256356.1 glycosyltransferase family 1 protein [Trematosphaeria pertusa]
MAPPPSSLYTLSFFLAALTTLLVCASLRLLAILPRTPFRPQPIRRKPIATRVLIVLGSGGHTHEMFYLLRELDTSKYTHRTYVVSSGDAFSAQRAVEFEGELEVREKARLRRKEELEEEEDEKLEGQNGKIATQNEERQACTGPDHYNVATVPRARHIYQSILTTPVSSLWTLWKSFPPLLAAPPLLPDQSPQTPYEAAAQDLPDLILTNGPATGVIIVLGSLILRFFNLRGANSRGKCKTVYVESFARVKTLSLSGKLLLRVVDRFVVQWEALEGKGGRAEFWGVLV